MIESQKAACLEDDNTSRVSCHNQESQSYSKTPYEKGKLVSGGSKGQFSTNVSTFKGEFGSPENEDNLNDNYQIGYSSNDDAKRSKYCPEEMFIAGSRRVNDNCTGKVNPFIVPNIPTGGTPNYNGFDNKQIVVEDQTRSNYDRKVTANFAYNTYNNGSNSQAVPQEQDYHSDDSFTSQRKTNQLRQKLQNIFDQPADNSNANLTGNSKKNILDDLDDESYVDWQERPPLRDIQNDFDGRAQNKNIKKTASSITNEMRYNSHSNKENLFEGDEEDCSSLNSKVYAMALYDFAAEKKKDLGFCKGDMIRIIHKKNSGWWLGEIGNKYGYIPSNYVQEQTN